MNFRCQVEDSTQRFSQTLSIFTHSSKQLPSLSHPNFRMEQRPMLLSPVRTHIDDTRSSSIGLLISNPLSPLRPEDMNVSNDGTNDEQKNFIEEPISSLYLRVHDSIVWTIVNGLSEPALILTGQPPYFILKGSLHWHDLMGYTPEAIFGKCLEHFIPSDYWFKNPYLSQIQKPFSSSSQEPDLNIISELNEDDLSTYDALMTFYRQLQFCSNAVYHHHIVLSLKAADDKILPFSLHALPIFKRQERRFGSDSVSGISAQLKSLVESGGDLPRNEVLPDDYIRSNTVAYYVVYMNHLTYLHPDHPDDVDQDRASSFVDRVLSVASSTISGGIGKSLFGPNAEKSHNIQNQYPSPPNIESESEDETWGRYSL